MRFQYTNRITGPLVGPLGRIQSSDLGEASKALGYAQKAVQVGATAASAAGSAVPGIGLVTAGIGLAAAGSAEAKTGAAAEIKSSQLVSAGATATAAVAQAAAVAAAGVAAGLTVGLVLLPIAAIAVVGSINTMNQVKRRATKQITEYKEANKTMASEVPIVVSCSDRLDEFYLLGRPGLMRDKVIEWLRKANATAKRSITEANLSSALDIVANGQGFIGIPGREIGSLRDMVATGIQDGIILYYATRDLLARLGDDVSNIPGQPRADVLRHGIAAFAYNKEQHGSTAWYRAMTGVLPDTNSGVPLGKMGEAPQQAPSLKKILDVVENRPGWGLWAIIAFWGFVDQEAFTSSALWKRIVEARVMGTIQTVSPRSDVPIIPSPQEVQAELKQIRAWGLILEQIVTGEESARATTYLAEAQNISYGGL